MATHKITFEEKEITTHENELVLDTLLRNNISVKFSCRNGTCMTCMLKVTEGTPTPVSQAGIAPNLKEKNYFKACKCIPSEDLKISRPEDEDYLYEAHIISLDKLDSSSFKIVIESSEGFDFHAGQQMKVRRKSYQNAVPFTITSLPYEPYMELAYYVKENSEELKALEKLKTGDKIFVNSPSGNFHFDPKEDKPLLILTKNNTLHIVKSVVNEAINLWSYEKTIEILQIGNEDQLAFEDFHLPTQVKVDSIPESDFFNNPKNYISKYLLHSIYLALNESKNEIMLSTFYSLGAQSIRVLNLSPKVEIESIFETQNFPQPPAEPDLELWEYLNENNLVQKILTEFYDIVFEDERLGTFFSHVTKQRLIEKQYNYLFEQFTGEPVYFGPDMRNVHHWMVISEDLFDYRSGILETVMRQNHLPEAYLKKWMEIEERVKERIVKSKPWKRIINNELVDLEQIEKTKLDFGGVCDNCHEEILPGEEVIYHVRLGKVFCQKCQGL